MSLHKLRAVTSDPRRDHIERLYRDVGAYDALPRLAAHHQGSSGTAPWRSTYLATAAPHVFPRPDDLVPLLDGLFSAIERLFGVARTDDDDLAVASFAAWGVTAIHPFDNGNGRTSFDFAQLLLMHRWSSPTALWSLPADGHQRLGVLLARFDEVSRDPAPQALVRLSRTLQGRFATTRLEQLSSSPLGRVAGALRTVLR